MLHAQQMVDNIRREIRAPGADAGYWLDTDIIEKLNEGQNIMEDEITHEHPEYFGVVFDAPALTDDGNGQYFLFPDVVKILRLLADQSTSPASIAVHSPVMEGNESYQVSHRGYEIFGPRVYVDPALSNTASGSLVIWAIINLPDLFIGLAQAGAAGTITFPATASHLDHHYVDTWIEIIAGAAVGDQRRVTAYDGTTKIATVDSDFSSTPDGTSKIATVSRIPARGLRLLQMYGSIRAKGMRGDDTRVLGNRLDQYLRTFTGNLKPNRAPEYVGIHDPEDGIVDALD